MTDHQFSPADDRCYHCGTLKAHHERVPQPCPGRPRTETLRPEPARREYSVEDAEVIWHNIERLRAEADAALNREEGPGMSDLPFDMPDETRPA